MLPSIWLSFCQFSPGFAYKSVAYKKDVYSRRNSGNIYANLKKNP